MTQTSSKYDTEITSHDLSLPCLPSGLDGARLVQLSDFHCGCGGFEPLVAEAVRQTNAMDPDIVALTGDFVDRSARDVPEIVGLLAGLKARVGVFASLGNHDHRGAADALISAFPKAGITLLNNAAQEILPGLWLAGVDELREGEPDIDATVAAIPAGVAAILLAHHPNTLDLIPPDRTLVLLAGHTHGGQIVLPYPTPTMICREHIHTSYVHGWYTHGKARMYVNRGLGVTGGWPLNRRFHCPPEISVFTLRSEPSASGIQESA